MTTPNSPYPAQQVFYVPVDAMRPAKTNGLAVASLVLGIVGSFLGWIYLVPPILAIIFGGVAMHQISNAQGRQGGKGLAISGLVLGIVFTAIYGLFFLAVGAST